MLLNHNDTITAIATPPGIGGIGVIRLSGENALSIIKSLFPNQHTLKPRYVYHGFIQHPTTHDPIDDACIIYYKGPKSYTGEDVVEIQCHGNTIVLQQIIEATLELGARLADKGEFTKRAFLNGKIDLTKAESIIDLIHANSEQAKKVSLNHLKGKLYEHIQSIRVSLMTVLEHIEGSIDFPDEIEPIDQGQLAEKIHKCQDQLAHIIDLQDYGKIVHDGVKCLIIGYPNVGKSSLLNQLLGEERAIVADLPGTTRDYIEARIQLGGLLFEFIDTAGIRQTDEEIEAIGIDRIKRLIPSAHAVLWVVDSTRELNDEERQLSGILKNVHHRYVVFNKIDSPLILNKQDSQFDGFKPLQISAKENTGMESLKEQLYTDIVSTSTERDLDILCNSRQIQCIKVAKDQLDHVQSTLTQHFESDVVSVDIKDAILKLGEITGHEVTEEVLDGIFQRFCVGK